MDIISMILARNSGGEKLAYTEIKEFSYDGILEGKDKIPAGSDYMVRVGVAIDPKTITKISGIMGGQITEVFAEDISVTETDTMFVVMANGLQLVAIIKESQQGLTGTYVIHANIGYVTSVEYEVIHPIDPKYMPQIPAEKLPGAVLPVVELSTETMQAMAEGQTQVNSEENAQLESAYTLGVPCVIRYSVEGAMILSTIASFDGTDTMSYYAQLNDDVGYKFTRGEDIWVGEMVVSGA